MRKIRIAVIWSLSICLLAGFIHYQETPYRINVQKDFGFNSGDRIRGTFSLAIAGDLDRIRSVTYLFDGQVFAEVSLEPYRVQFKTQDYPPGSHEFAARIETRDGAVFLTAGRNFEFVSAEDETAELQRIMLPIFGGVILLMAAVICVQWLVLRERPKTSLPLGAARHYGVFGGTICPKCRRPFSMHWWAMRVGFHRYDRCDYCGRWSLVRRRRPEDLAAAEAAEVVDSHNRSQISPSFEWKDEIDRLDNTRYVDKV